MSARKESGLSIKAFCEKAGIHDNTYYYWQRRLRLAASGALHGTDLVASGFAEVTLSNQPVPSSPAVSVQNQISIESSGIRITAGSEYPADKLVAVLREVVRPC
jgi:transposase-like protein